MEACRVDKRSRKLFMKTRFSLVVALCLIGGSVRGASIADDLISHGRALLATQDLRSANTRFAAAVGTEPEHEVANVFYAATRLLVLPEVSPLKEFLDHAGLAATNRNLLDWGSRLAVDTNDVPILPGLTNLNQGPDVLRDHILAEVAAAETNLSRVISRGFSLNLSEKEIVPRPVQLDLGDVIMLRSLLKAAEYFGYTLHSWNWEAQIESVRQLFGENPPSSMERFLSEHSEMFTFAHPSDLNRAKMAFGQAVGLYLEASKLIAARPPNSDRLFNLDESLVADESEFRKTLEDLRDSLDRVVVLRGNTNTMVHLGRTFDGSVSVRQLLPAFSESSVVLGTLPDLTFGGAFGGLKRGDVEQFLHNPSAGRLGLEINMVPQMTVPFVRELGSLEIGVDTLAGRSYVVQETKDFRVWRELVGGAILAQDEATRLVIPLTGADSGLFYRISESARPGNDDFAARATVRGTNVIVRGSLKGSTLETGEPSGHWGHSAWWSWSAPADCGARLSVESPFYLYIAAYTGDQLSRLQEAFLPYRQGDVVTFRATRETTYEIAAMGWHSEDYILKLNTYPLPVNDSRERSYLLSGATATAAGSNIGANAEDNEPTHATDAAGHSVWWRWSAPATGRYAITTTGSDFDVRFAVYVSAEYPKALRSGARLSTALDCTAGTEYLIAVDTARYGADGQARIKIQPVLEPVNDSFSRRLPLVGTNVVAAGNNLGATSEPGEPDVDESGSKSLWWTWTAPEDGGVSMSSAGSTFQAQTRVYSGAAVSSMRFVASGYGNSSPTLFNVRGGQTYFVKVGSSDGDYGDFRIRLNWSPPPGNDAFAMASSVQGDEPQFSGRNLGASIENGEPSHGSESYRGRGSTVWWKWTAPADGDYWLENAGGAYDVVASLYSGNSLASLLREAVVDGYARGDSALLEVKAGRTYFVAADTSFALSEDLWLRLRRVLAPANDSFREAVVLKGSRVRLDGANIGATHEGGEIEHGGAGGTKSVWWVWTSPERKETTITLTTAAMKGVVAVYTGDDLGTLTMVNFARTSGAAKEAVIVFRPNAGTVYYIVVDGVDGSSGTFGLRVDQPE